MNPLVMFAFAAVSLLGAALLSGGYTGRWGWGDALMLAASSAFMASKGEPRLALEAAERATEAFGAAQDDAPLVIGIIGRGHLEFRGGTPWQLQDLGIPDAMVFLPWDEGTPHHPGQSDASCVMPPRP